IRPQVINGREHFDPRHPSRALLVRRVEEHESFVKCPQRTVNYGRPKAGDVSLSRSFLQLVENLPCVGLSSGCSVTIAEHAKMPLARASCSDYFLHICDTTVIPSHLCECKRNGGSRRRKGRIKFETSARLRDCRIVLPCMEEHDARHPLQYQRQR